MEYTVEGVQVHENPSGLLITSIEGLGPGKATINKTDLPTSDGVVVNSVRLSEKNIVIHGKFLNSPSIEDARILSYRMFPIKQKVTFLIETDNRTATIVGYVESNEPLIFSDSSEVQISIVCESAYFTGKEINISAPRYDQPNELIYGGDAENGMVIEANNRIYAHEAESRITDPIMFSVNDDVFKINLQKMASNVEDTAFMNVHYKSLAMAYTEYDSRCVGNLAENTDDPTKLSVFHPVIIDDELHYFGLYSNASIRHYKYDRSARRLMRLPDVGYNGPNRQRQRIFCTAHGGSWYMGWDWLLNYNGAIYLYVSPKVASIYTSTTPLEYNHAEDHSMFRYDPEQNAFIDMPTEYTIPTVNIVDDAGDGFYSGPKNWHSNYIAILNGKPYAFVTTIRRVETGVIYGSNSGSTTGSGYQYVTKTWVFEFKGDSWENVLINGNARIAEMDNREINLYSVIAFDNKIHFMSEDKHFSWDGENLQSVSMPFDDLSMGVATYDGMIYVHGIELFKMTSSTAQIVGTLPGITATYERDGTTWMYGYKGPVIEYEDAMFFAGGDQSYYPNDTNLYYSEEGPNNTCLIGGDKIVVSTYKGKKSVSLYRQGKKYNIINAMDRDSKWLQFHIGSNVLSFTESSTGNLEVTIESHELYEGV